jgi:hypothetical protein
MIAPDSHSTVGDTNTQTHKHTNTHTHTHTHTHTQHETRIEWGKENGLAVNKAYT